MSVFSNFSPIYLGVVAWHQKVKAQLQEELRRIEDKILFQRQCKFVSYLFDYGMISDPNDDVDVHLGDEDHHYIDVDVDVDDHDHVDDDDDFGETKPSLNPQLLARNITKR